MFIATLLVIDKTGNNPNVCFSGQIVQPYNEIYTAMKRNKLSINTMI